VKDGALESAYLRSDAQIAVLEEMPVGTSLAAGLVAMRAKLVDAQSSVRIHALWSKVISWAYAQQMIATNDSLNGVRAFYPDVFGDEHILAAQEIAAATCIPFATAMAQIELADDIGDCMPASWVAIDRGELTLGHIKSLHRTLRNSAPAPVERVETKLIPIAVARRWTPSELARASIRGSIGCDE
jgi:hypothetical protein